MKHPFHLVLCDEDGQRLFASVKNHLQVFELKTGKVLGSWVDEEDYTTPLKKQQKEKIEALKSKEGNKDEISLKKLKLNEEKPIKVPKIPVPGPGAPQIYNTIRSLSLSKDNRHLIITTDSDKSVVIFEINYEQENCLHMIKRQVCPKRPCATSIDDTKVIIADKFGDIYSIPLDSSPSLDEKNLKPLLGHVSMLSDVILTSYNGKKYIITSDRDEHIRISNYPNTFVIRNWLFGHHEFVSTLNIPTFEPTMLISGGGDDYLCIWNWVEEKLVSKVDLREIIEPFLNDDHLPPERFLEEDSPKEIAVSKVLTYLDPLNQRKFAFVLCENTSCIIVFEIIGFSFIRKQTFKTSHPIIDLCLIEKTGYLIGALDTESDDKLLAFYKMNENQELMPVDNDDLVKKISTSNECNADSRKEFYPFYHVNTLRKRSEH